MKFLITGGLGFIGSSFIRLVHAETLHEILNLDKESYASMPESLSEIENSERYNFVKLNIHEYKDLYKEIKDFKPNIILHFAAESHVDNSIDHPRDFLDSNIIGTFNLLECIKNLKDLLPENFRYIHVSTDEVFGSLDLNEKSFVEESVYKPNSPYSATKASSDLLVRAWWKTYKLPLIVTNCSNNYGPWQFPEKLIPLVIYKLINKKKLPIYGNGKNIRDWIFVDDHIRALILISQKGKIGQKYMIVLLRWVLQKGMINLNHSKRNQISHLEVAQFQLSFFQY